MRIHNAIANPRAVPYPLDAALDVTPGEWEYTIPDYWSEAGLIRMNGNNIAHVLPATGTQFDGSEYLPDRHRTRANGMMLAASKDLADALLGAESALMMLQGDPEASVDFGFHLQQINNALWKAGFPAREKE